MSNVQELLDRGLKLNLEERGELAARILATTIPEPPDTSVSQDEWERVWGDEIEARFGRFERGEMQALSWGVVYNETKAKFFRQPR